MITSKTYSNKLEELLHVSYKDRDVIPAEEPVFNVDLNTRKIDVPVHFRDLATKGDHKAETIWFALDRYFDGKDLSLKSWDIVVDENTGQKDSAEVTWAVQFKNALGEECLHPITWRNITPSDAGQDPDFYKEGEKATLNLGWDIHYDLTKAAGHVTFSLRCFALYGSDIIYNISTEPVTAYIRDGLYIEERNNENLMNPPKDNLTDLVAKISSLYENTSLTNLSYENINKGTLPKIDGTLVYGEMTSADFKNIDYKQILNTPIYRINGEELQPGGNLELLTEADSALDATSTNPIQNRPVKIEFDRIDAAIAAINEELGNMTYIPLKIKSFTNSLNLLEKGSRYTGDCVFAWSLDGNLKTLKLVNTKTNVETEVEDPEIAGETTIAFVDLTDSVEYKLVVSDPKGNESSEITNIDFVHKLFYGKAPLQESYSESFLTEILSGELSKTKSYEFTVNAGADDYIYFCLPESYGTPKFWSGGFEGGFTLNGSAVYNLNNTTYNIWKSDNKGLGETTITVK